MYYITCPEVTVNFADFPTTPTGREVTLIEQAQGVCVANAEYVDLTSAASAPFSDSTALAAATGPTYLCKGDGKWYLPTGSCKCKAGFEPDFDKQKCNGEFCITFTLLLLLMLHVRGLISQFWRVNKFYLHVRGNNFRKWHFDPSLEG